MCESALAQHTAEWFTNYYAVTGSTPREIRASMRQSRPWKDAQQALDASTVWRVEWKYDLASTPHGCDLRGFRTKATIRMTLPRWTPPPEATDEMRQNWARFFKALLAHEVGHAQHGQAAAAEMHKKVRALSRDVSCSEFNKSIKTLCDGVVDAWHKRERDYDVRTEHGAKQGATFP